ncbi:hypothetical protein U0070_026190 [Myodes glareolus]|uniref:G-protein coupled receptors family 1 profile domain-containing protein n=1 Tax=Myodes glareolus TaxID=447135 RepID=A0AAW0GXX2_MYOGA
MNQKSKLYTYTNIRNIFFFETSIGISGNSVLLLFHVLTLSSEHKPRLTDLPIGFLAVIHLLMLLVASIIATDIFMFHQGWDNITCKSLIFLYRFLRGLSVCATCWLSVLQAITLSPRNSCLVKCKRKLSPCHNLWSLFALCSVYSSIATYLFISMVKSPNVTSDHLLYMTESCALVHFSFPMKYVMSTLFIFRDVFVMGIMILSSGYMLILLCRHKKQVQHLHSTSFSPKASLEQRASRTILLLLCFFVVMCILDSFMTFSRHMFKDDPIFYLILILVGHSYASVSPFVFISTEKDIIGILRSMCEKKLQTFLFTGGDRNIICKFLLYLYGIYGASPCVPPACLESSRLSSLVPEAPVKQSQAQISLSTLIALLPMSFSYRSIGHHSFGSFMTTHILTLGNYIYVMRSTFSTVLALRETFLTSLMAFSSGCMLILLCRHKKLSQHLHSTRLCPKSSPEIRDTQTILLLLSIFVLMSILDSID